MSVESGIASVAPASGAVWRCDGRWTVRLGVLYAACLLNTLKKASNPRSAVTSNPSFLEAKAKLDLVAASYNLNAYSRLEALKTLCHIQGYP